MVGFLSFRVEDAGAKGDTAPLSKEESNSFLNFVFREHLLLTIFVGLLSYVVFQKVRRGWKSGRRNAVKTETKPNLPLPTFPPVKKASSEKMQTQLSRDVDAKPSKWSMGSADSKQQLSTKQSKNGLDVSSKHSFYC